MFFQMEMIIDSGTGIVSIHEFFMDTQELKFRFYKKAVLENCHVTDILTF